MQIYLIRWHFDLCQSPLANQVQTSMVEFELGHLYKLLECKGWLPALWFVALQVLSLLLV